MRKMRFHALLLLTFAVLFAWTATRTPSRAETPVPVVHERVLATVVGGELAITGENFGDESVARSLRFDYEGQSTVIDASSSDVTSWGANAITFRLPLAVRPGTLTVTVGGASSSSVAVLVYVYTRIPLTASPGTNAFPLTLATAADGRAWVIEEYHTQLKSISPDYPAKANAITIPEAESGIFAQSINGDSATTISGLGEDIDIASDGSIWFVQGGGSHYEGTHPNSSRIVRYRPSSQTFSCYPVPTDNSRVFGLVVDDERGMVWYTESDFTRGNAISGFNPNVAYQDCGWVPGGGRPPICTVVRYGCHQRFPLPAPNSRPAQLVLDDTGRIWFTEFWNNALGVLDPDTGVVMDLPFPATIAKAGPGIWVRSGPWELAWGADGALWATEFFDATLSRIDTGSISALGCTALDANGNNPCIHEVVVASDGLDGRTMHSLAVGAGGRVWFGVSGDPSRLGFVSTSLGNDVTYLPTLTPGTSLGGVAEDAATGDIWFTQYEDKSIGRLQLATGDGDGIADAFDNCPSTYNPGQENADRNFVDLSPWNKPFNDLTWPASDTMGNACDSDADNDGLANSVEAGLPSSSCASASAVLDPFVRDTDGDLNLDGAECMLGTDPAKASSKPLRFPPGDNDRDGLADVIELLLGTNPASTDTDGDRLGDGLEVRYYGSDPLSRNGDGDACGDIHEAVSLNGDTSVNAIDIFLIATSVGASTSAAYVPAFDVNRDSTINIADLGFAASSFGLCQAN